MAIYPPILEGTLPPCYFNSNKTELLINLPYSYSRGVNPNSVIGIKILIKTVPLNNTIYQSEVLEISEDNLYKFNLYEADGITINSTHQALFESMHEGQYYKFQMAFVEEENQVGYWSTAGIAKLIGLPQKLELEYQGNLCIGTYKSNNNDLNETLYSSSFVLKYNNKIIEQSPEIIHKYIDGYTENDEIKEYYTLKTSLEYGKLYDLEWHILTNNGYSTIILYNSPLSNNNILPQTYNLQPLAIYDRDNAYIKIGIKKAFEGNDNIYHYGNYLIQRSSSKDNYKLWTTIGQIDGITKAQISYPGTERILYQDFNLEYGVTYKYSLQEIFENNNLSIRSTSDLITAYFDDMFLYDEERQLCIKYNPKVSSFKNVVQEQKTDPLGGKYPIFFRNGEMEYKEFSISGLISYLVDQNNLFNEKFNNYSTSLSDENLMAEFKFSSEVLDWLNDGEYKYFKSPAEGTYKVRLMNISLSPNDQLSRMLYTFQATAYEIGEINDYNYQVNTEILNIVSDNTVMFSLNSASNRIELSDDYKLGVFTSIGITNIPNNRNYLIVQFQNAQGQLIDNHQYYITQAGFWFNGEITGLKYLTFLDPSSQSTPPSFFANIEVYFEYKNPNQYTPLPQNIKNPDIAIFTATTSINTPLYYYKLQAIEKDNNTLSFKEKTESSSTAPGPNILRITDSSFNTKDYIVMGQLLLEDFIAYQIEFGNNLEINCTVYGDVSGVNI